MLENLVRRWQTGKFNSLRDKIAMLLRSSFRSLKGYSLGGLHLVFVFDEARQLNVASETGDRFDLARRALRALPFSDSRSSFNFLAVFTETDTSRIANFLPAAASDFSHRVQEEKRKLFEPFVFVKALGAWWRDARKLQVAPMTSRVADTLEALRQGLSTAAKANVQQHAKLFLFLNG